MSPGPDWEGTKEMSPGLERIIITQLQAIQVHDEPMPGVWSCGRCPYMNCGPVCTKCAAPRYEGMEFDLC